LRQVLWNFPVNIEPLDIKRHVDGVQTSWITDKRPDAKKSSKGSQLFGNFNSEQLMERSEGIN
jgi:hypothetical protein